MAKQAFLHLLRDGRAVHTVALGPQPLHVGRGPANGIVLADPTVSTHHAVLWTEAGDVWVRDLDSKNGTFIEDNAVRGASKVPERVKLRLGANSEMRISFLEDADALLGHIFLLEHDGIAFPVAGDRFYVGTAPESHLRLPSGPGRLLTLLVHKNGEVWAGTQAGEFPVELGKPFDVEGHLFRLVPADAAQVPTVEAEPTTYPYRLSATLNGASGPEAVLEDPDRNLRYRVDADNRAILLYLLARQLLADRAGRTPPEEQGWISDDDVTAGIWGRNAPAPNSLHVLVYRVRRQLEKAGFDPWFIEKRQKAMRVRLADVALP